MTLMECAHGGNESQAATLAPERAAGSAHFLDGGVDFHLGQFTAPRRRHRAAIRLLHERLAVRRQQCRGYGEWRPCPALNLWAWRPPGSPLPVHTATRRAAIA